MMKLLDLIRPMQAQGLRAFALLTIACLGARLGATNYQGISTTNPGAALYYAGNRFAADTDSYTGFVSFGAGLVMPSGSGSVTVGTVGRLDGSLSFPPIGGSTAAITLSDDLVCNSLFRIHGEATIDGGGYSLRLTGSLTLNDTDRILPTSGLIIDGQGHTLTLVGTESISFSAVTTVTLRNMTLVLGGAGGIPITAFALTGASLTLDNVKVVMSTDASIYSFVFNTTSPFGAERLCIENEVNFSGPGATFMHNSTMPLVIRPGATLTFEPGTTFLYLAGRPDRLYMSDQTSKLRFNSCTFAVPGAASNSVYSGVTTPGLQLLKGMVEIDNKVFIENDGQSSSAKGLIFGDGVHAANNVAVNILSGASVIIDGFMYYKQA